MPTRQNSSYGTLTLLPSSARSVSGFSEEWDSFGQVVTMRVQSEVTAISGSGASVTVSIEDSIDGVNFNRVGSIMTAQTAVGRVVQDITTPFADRIRVRYDIAGTGPSVTHNVQVFAQGANA